MKRNDRIPEIFTVQVGVYFRGKNGFMSQHFLNSPRSAPPSTRWVAKECRKVCGLTFFSYTGFLNQVLYNGKYHYPGKLIAPPVKKYNVFSPLDRIHHDFATGSK